MLVTEMLRFVLDVELPLVLVLLQLVNDMELGEVEVDDVEVELMLVEEILSLALDVGLLLALVLLEVVDDVELEEVEVDDV